MEPKKEDAEDNEKLEFDSRSRSPSPARKKLLAKAAEILETCQQKDLDTLRMLAISEGGLVSDEVRRQACSCHQVRLLDLD